MKVVPSNRRVFLSSKRKFPTRKVAGIRTKPSSFWDDEEEDEGTLSEAHEKRGEMKNKADMTRIFLFFMVFSNA